MDCETSTTLLPWLLNGSLDPAEREEVERHLLSCERCREELGTSRLAFDLYGTHPSAEELAEYAAGELPAAAAPLIADHLERCEGCRDELGLLAESRRDSERAFGPFESSVVPFTPAIPGRRWRLLAAAASLVALFTSGGWLWTWLAEHRSGWPALNVAVLEVLPTELAQRGGETNELVVGAQTGGVTLILLSQHVAEGSEHEIEVSDAGGRVLWRQSGLARDSQGDFTVSLPPALLAVERLRVAIIARVDGRRVQVETYEIRIRR